MTVISLLWIKDHGLGLVLNCVQPMRSETDMQAAALRGQIHPSAYTKASRVTVQTISAA